MYILEFILLIVLFFLLFKTKEGFSQDYYPHLYNSNIIPCSSSIK